MHARIAALMVAVAGITAATALPASAATVADTSDKVACIAAVNLPCAWQETTDGGFVGVAQVSAADPAQLTLVRVEVRTQRAWGSPWVTVASATTVTHGSAKAVTPRVVTGDLRMICATGGPALDAAQRVTTCTNPF
ncbi:hypothetical protein J5Y04_19020 [Kitasatospora sp. RG8]|uniref:hypothetical protein n=1 Tax=Kitasatospora sp. RG8 TaxID=2820815 RepID=UPI001ADF03BC|nr:hypothetical protein [Kitasatospora sp. RG8]MBP0451622.1 hypothetical protein [Kitasatospora sp. RG8]